MAEHLLALKVMRLSRPSLSVHPQPYFADSNTLAAHAQASPLSLEGSSPLPGIPSTLRDFGLSSVLLLPEAFGSISLGETFTSSLCVNNESALEIIGGHLLVEIQTASNKIALGEIGGIDSRLQPNQMLQLVVSHEIKELGQHVLACTVSYHVPPALRNSTVPPEDPANPTLRTIRKFYKFMVSNPLSVRTKVHIPRSPTALLNKLERHKVFLEVHVQNLTTKPLHFERIQFECADGWKLDDCTTLPNSDDRLSLLQPQDLRQHMYILVPTPDATPSFPIPYPPGTIIGLGRLDMSWRSSFGEPGRLLTSMLSRKIPLPAAPPAASAIPPHLQRQGIGRPGSPAPYTKSRGGVPGRPQSPAMGRPMSPSLTGSFAGTTITPSAPLPGVMGAGMAIGREVEVDLVVREAPETVYLDCPFTIKFSMGALAALPAPSAPSSPPSDPYAAKADAQPKRARLIRFAVQHTHPTPPAPPPPVSMAPEVSSPRALLSALSSPGGGATPRMGMLDLGSILQGEPRILPGSVGGTGGSGGQGKFTHPYSPTAPPESPAFIGSSTQLLPPIILSTPAPTPTIGPLVAIAKNRPGPVKGEGWVDFDLKYVCVNGAGRMKRVGGLRVWVVEDREMDMSEELDVVRGGGKGGTLIREWDVVGEVWAERAINVESGLA